MKLIYLILFITTIIFVSYAYLTVDNSSDDIKIAALFRQATQAANDKDLSGLISKVSNNYKDSEGLSKDRLRLLIVQVFRNSGKFNVETTIEKTVINEDKAEVTIKADIKSTNLDVDFIERTITFNLEKEKGYHMGVIPTKFWRVVKSSGFDFGDYD